MGSSLISQLFQPAALVVIGAIYVVYLIGLAIYRRFFHPLAKVPGPFLPAVTIWYQTLFNGRYFLEVERMHKKYGRLGYPKT